MIRRSIPFIVFLCAAVSSATAQIPAIRLTLADAVSRGNENSHRLAEAKAREAGAQAAVDTADAASRPIVNANAGYMRTNHVAEFSFPQPGGKPLVVYPDLPDNFTSRLSFQWPIYTSGRTDALERAAIAEAQAAGSDVDTTRADLRLEIVRAYWGVATAREAVRVLEESSARSEAQLKDARQRFDVGLTAPNEVAAFEAQRSNERSQLIQAENLRESSLIDLRRLIGVPQDTVLELVDALDAGPTAVPAGAVDQLVKEALDARAERKALTLRIGGAEERQKAASTGNKPTVSLAGGVDYANPNPKHFPRQDKLQRSWDIGVNLNWNFVDFGRARAQVAEAAAAVTATRERLAEFDTIVSADVRQRLLDLDSSQAILGAAADAVRSAAESRRVIGDRFNAGVATSTDVLVAQVQLLESQMTRTRALANVRLAEARLERALGR